MHGHWRPLKFKSIKLVSSWLSSRYLGSMEWMLCNLWKWNRNKKSEGDHTNSKSGREMPPSRREPSMQRKSLPRWRKKVKLIFYDTFLLQLIAHGPGQTGATAQRPAKTAQRRGIGRFFRKSCTVEVLALSMSLNMRCATWMYFVQVGVIKWISSSLLQWIVL